MDVKQRILELMEKRGWSKYRLAKETGIYITTVNDWFNENNIHRAEIQLSVYVKRWGLLWQSFMAE